MGRLAKVFMFLAVMGLATFLMSSCTSLPFHPVRELEATPAALGLPYEDVQITTRDEEIITGWYIPAADNASRYTLLFFHGNAGNMSHRLESLDIFHQLGLAVLIIDYRGFGGSTGSPSVNGTLLDARAAWGWLVKNKRVSADDVIIFGRSLGGAVAADLAAQVTPRALILESTFTSLYDVACKLYPWLPVSSFLPQDYNTLARLQGLKIALLVIHSPDDEVVSYELGRKIYDSYLGLKQFLELSGGHNFGFQLSRERYILGLQYFLRSLDQSPEQSLEQSLEQSPEQSSEQNLEQNSN